MPKMYVYTITVDNDQHFYAVWMRFEQCTKLLKSMPVVESELTGYAHLLWLCKYNHVS